MYVCVYVCLCVRMYVCMYVSASVRSYVCTYYFLRQEEVIFSLLNRVTGLSTQSLVATAREGEGAVIFNKEATRVAW